MFGTSGDGVYTTLIDSQDRIWVHFGSNITVLNQPNYASRLVRVNPDGILDEDFNAPVFSGYLNGTYENPTFPTDASAAVVEDEDGTFIVNGQFTEINGDHHRRIAKITDSGDVIQGAMQALGPDSVWDDWNGAAFGLVMSASAGVVKKLPDGKLLIGGRFSSFGGEPYHCLVRLQPAGFVGTDDRDNRGALKLYPNPARYHFRIELPDGVEGLQTLELCDMQGRVVRSWSAAQSPFNTGGLPAGMYVVRASGKNGVYTQKLILH
ncbi:MAG: T9SS type A sorting domain-containing protein [Flavobacteriales bacterium]|nr:T9SS type A sorting domain-containing protein [Flavobacteriales bacterium]